MKIKKGLVKNKCSGCKICNLEDAFREHSGKVGEAEKIEKHLSKRTVAEMCVVGSDACEASLGD